MPQMILNGKAIELIPDDDWTTTEVTNADKALGTDYFNATSVEQMKVAIFVSAMRDDPSLDPVNLADAIGRAKLGSLVSASEGADESPLPRNGATEDRETFGAPLSGNLASLSPSEN